jgi:N-acetylglucosamine kinase-like BadF-type ATPase
MDNLVIGVDGGGSRTRARLANARGETLGTGEAGAANPHADGLQAAQREILSAIRRAFDDAHLEQQIVAAACLGIGGVERADERAQWQAWARETIAKRVEVMNDGEIVLAAGSPENWGVALIAGTGSIVWGKARDGRIARAGGWGYLIGDEGSAFDLAREALRAVAQAADGRGEDTRLLPVILEFWNLREPMELIPRVYRSGLKPADIARLAPVIVRIAEEGDGVARKLIERAGAALADTVIVVARALQFEQAPLALAGGLLLEAETVRARLLDELQARAYTFAPVKVVHEPVAGAVRIAVAKLSSPY